MLLYFWVQKKHPITLY